MSPADQYRIRAARLAAEARQDGHGIVREELLGLAQAYLRLAELAEKNTHCDAFYQTPGASPPVLGP